MRVMGMAGTVLGCAILLWSGTPGAWGAEQTLVLQQGAGGYTGVRDTNVQTNDWDTPPQFSVNYGQNAELFLDRDGGSNVLVRFDLSAIPANSRIISATLQLYNVTGSGSQALSRRIGAHRVLVDWDEGNQVAARVSTTPGAHGATGDNAFEYYPGEGTNIPWGARGMEAGTDFEAATLAAADVVDEGWYSWELTGTVQRWVRGEWPNYGVVLRDQTGWQDGNTDWRSFASSQASEPDRRPVLRIVYDPDTPLPEAGPDVEDLHWDGSPVTLDGSASHDHPGGDDSSLQYSWRIAAAAFGSAMSGEICSSAVCTFQPDVAGEWTLELEVSNREGSTASDTVHLRLLSIPVGHPRLFLTPAKLAALRSRVDEANPRWTALLGQADAADGDKLAKALVRQVLDDPSYCQGADGAVAKALDEIAGAHRWATQAGDIAIVYDWCHEELTSADRNTILGYFADSASDGDDIPGWGNYWPRWGYSYGLAGLAALDEAPGAEGWMDEYRHRRFEDFDVANLDRIAPGGGWPEGTVYDWIANLWRVKAVAGWTSATGEHLFAATGWFRERLGYLPMLYLPGTADSWGHPYHPYVGHGDAERNRGPMADYGRIMGLILIEAFPAEPAAQALQAYLSAPPVDHPDSFLAHEEFLFYNPAEPTRTPTETGWFAAGTGDVFLRSGWPSGAADTSTDVTLLEFHCGDRFSYHQHYEEGSFTLFSGEPLLLDSGVYSGEGLSYHDVNYYVRTIAHNTLIVYNPSEDFSSARPDAVSNDGGQRTPYPGTRAPESVAYQEEHAPVYETGNITAFENTEAESYIRADVTPAYNNLDYNQADSADLPGNVAKVSRFERELLYLRRWGRWEAEAVVLYDRVAVTDPAFSGANTKLLFHMLQEPTVDGPWTDVSAGETLFESPTEAIVTAPAGARATVRFLLPLTRHVRRVGGRGEKSFWVFDDNYDWHWESTEPQPRPVNDFEDTPWGEWRLELEPADTALVHRFLTVILPDASGAAPAPATLALTGDGVEGALIGDASLQQAVLFSSADDGTPSASPIHYVIPQHAALVHHTVVDLPPGSSWRLHLDVSEAGVTLTPVADSALEASSAGVLRFSTAAITPCDPNLDLACDSEDLVEEIRSITEAGHEPGGDPDLDENGQLDGADQRALVRCLFAQ